MRSYNYPKEKRNSDSTNLLRSLIFEKAGWYLALLANKIKIRPNTVTLISIIPGIYGIYCNSQSNFFMGILSMGIYYLLDNVDGHLARLSKKTSIYGSYLDDSIGIILWPFYWGSFIFMAETLEMKICVIILTLTSEARSLFGYKFLEKSKNNTKSIKKNKSKNTFILKLLLLQLTNVGGVFFLVFPLLICYNLKVAIMFYSILYFTRYFLLALNYGYKLWKL